MKKTTIKPKRAWVFATAVAAGIAGYVFLIFLPVERATANLREELEQKRQFVTDCQHTHAVIKHLEQELDRTGRFVASWRESAPNEARLAQVFVCIVEHAEHSSADIVRFEPKPVDRMDVIERIPVEMACEGSYGQIMDFLGKLESLTPDFWITDLKLEPAGPGATRLRCELNLAFFADRREISD